MMETDLSKPLTAAGTHEETLSVIGHTIKVIIGGDRTANAYSIFELNVPPGIGPGLHIDQAWDEWWFVIEGTFALTLNGEPLQLNAGDFAHGPKGVPHTFKNAGETTGKLVMVTMPSGLEKFFRNVHQASLNGRPDKEAFVRIMRSHNIEPA